MAEYAAAGSAGLSAVGGVVGALGAQSGAETQAQGYLAAGRAEADKDFFNAGQYDFQALIDERNRAIALDQARAAARDTRRKNAAQIGQIRAAYGASGLSLEGSPLDVLQATAAEQELDVRKVLYEGDIVAVGLTDEAAQARANASMLRFSGSNALTAGNVAASGARTAGNYASAAALIGGFAGAAKSYTSPYPGKA